MIINVDKTVIAQGLYSNGIVYIGSKLVDAMKNLPIEDVIGLATASSVLVVYYDSKIQKPIRAVLVNEFATLSWEWNDEHTNDF